MQYIGAICDMVEKRKRTRRRCPFHQRLEYGELVDYYDTRRLFFDCGVVDDYGYGYWRISAGSKANKEDKAAKKAKRLARKLARAEA